MFVTVERQPYGSGGGTGSRRVRSILPAGCPGRTLALGEPRTSWRDAQCQKRRKFISGTNTLNSFDNSPKVRAAGDRGAVTGSTDWGTVGGVGATPVPRGRMSPVGKRRSPMNRWVSLIRLPLRKPRKGAARNRRPRRKKVGVRNSRPSRGETVGIPDQALIRLGVADSGCRHRSPGWARRAPVALPQNGGCSDGRRRGVTRTAPDGCTARSQGPHDFRALNRTGASAVQLPDSTAGRLGIRCATTGNGAMSARSVAAAFQARSSRAEAHSRRTRRRLVPTVATALTMRSGATPHCVAQ